MQRMLYKHAVEYVGPIPPHSPSGSASSGYCPTGGPHTSTACAKEHASGARGRAHTPPQQAPTPGTPTEREQAHEDAKARKAAHTPYHHKKWGGKWADANMEYAIELNKNANAALGPSACVQA